MTRATSTATPAEISYDSLLLLLLWNATVALPHTPKHTHAHSHTLRYTKNHELENLENSTAIYIRCDLILRRRFSCSCQRILELLFVSYRYFFVANKIFVLFYIYFVEEKEILLCY